MQEQIWTEQIRSTFNKLNQAKLIQVIQVKTTVNL